MATFQEGQIAEAGFWLSSQVDNITCSNEMKHKNKTGPTADPSSQTEGCGKGEGGFPGGSVQETTATGMLHFPGQVRGHEKTFILDPRS